LPDLPQGQEKAERRLNVQFVQLQRQRKVIKAALLMAGMQEGLFWLACVPVQYLRRK
jgi:hypothetical protein